MLWTEVHLYNLLTADDCPTDVPMDKSWHFNSLYHKCSPFFQLLSSLAATCYTIFHGNANVEWFFGRSHDIDDYKKQNILSGKQFNGDIILLICIISCSLFLCLLLICRSCLQIPFIDTIIHVIPKSNFNISSH